MIRVGNHIVNIEQITFAQLLEGDAMKSIADIPENAPSPALQIEFAHTPSSLLICGETAERVWDYLLIQQCVREFESELSLISKPSLPGFSSGELSVADSVR